MKRMTIWAVLALALTMPAPASATDLFLHVSSAIRRVEAQWANRAFTDTLNWGVDSVTRGYQTGGSFVANANGRIVIVAGCDQDCSRLRLTVTDFRNQTIASQDGIRGAAEVSFVPQLGQTYRFHVEPLDCSTPYCFVVWNAVR